MEYLCCPFCAWVRPIKYGNREVRFDKVDPSRVKVWQLRKLTGGIQGQPRGGHIRIVDSKIIPELSQKEKEKIKNQAEKIIALCK